MTNHEIYFSTDIETDGPIPGPHSMLSLGSAAFSSDGVLLGTFSANLKTLPEAKPDPKTAEWWKSQPGAWAACRENVQDPADALVAYIKWVKELSGTGKPVFVAFPAGFDFMFVYWYMIKFAGESPFSFSALDGKTYAMALLKRPYRQSTKRNYPKAWFPPKSKHTHIALDDAIEQGRIFCNMLRANA
jgi:hypothetical protein